MNQENWIPVTERLPENKTRCLVTFVTIERDHIEVISDTFDENSWPLESQGFFKVLAYIPYPEPFIE